MAVLNYTTESGGKGRLYQSVNLGELWRLYEERGVSEITINPTKGGIIPARAGFTPRGDQEGRQGRDHPRSRGVYRRTCARVRRRSWIIPARAGFTPDDLGPAVGQRDHPRSRGVYHQDGVPAVVQGGSSPLARGLRRRSRGGS